MSISKFLKRMILVVLVSIPWIIIGQNVWAKAFTNINTVTDSATGIITFTQRSFTNNTTDTETERTQVPMPIDRRSYLDVDLVVSNETGCNVEAYLEREEAPKIILCSSPFLPL